jgi:hypothetical protein
LLQIADVALRKFASRTGLHYELHTIYGDSLLDDEDFNNYFHIDFVGQPKEDHHSSSSGAEPCFSLLKHLVLDATTFRKRISPFAALLNLHHLMLVL